MRWDTILQEIMSYKEAPHAGTHMNGLIKRETQSSATS